MTIRSIALNALRFLVALAALAVLFLTPVVAAGPQGNTYQPLGIVADVAALVVVVLLVRSWWPRRSA